MNSMNGSFSHIVDAVLTKHLTLYLMEFDCLFIYLIIKKMKITTYRNNAPIWPRVENYV